MGDQWRRQWDSLRLYSPARYDALPGLPFPGDPWDFPGKDDVAAYLESYARHWSLPVRLGVAVERVTPAEGGGFVVHTSAADGQAAAGSLHCHQLVVATGTFGRFPVIPDEASQLDPSILQLHSSEYRRPAQLRRARCSWSAPPTRAPTSPTSWPSRARRRSRVETAARSRSDWARRCRRRCSRSWCSPGGTCSPDAPRSAARRWG
ncbi:MAG: NAD(P)-binding domain-containing protein [Nocardioides sp.]